MKAIVVRELTGPAGVELQDMPEPDPGSSLVLVRVEAAGVSFPDLLRTQGLYQMKSEPPFVLGTEVAGTVISAPDGCGLGAGDRVYGGAFGAFAERIAVPPEAVYPLPEPLDFAQGAAVLVNYQTAWFALADRAGFRAGESLLVLGASGGVGTAVIQVARGIGASRILGLVSTEEKGRVALEAGVDEVVLYEEGWKDRVRELTDGRGVDLVYDPVGGDRFLDGLRSLASGGRLLVIGFASGTIPEVRVNRLLLNNIAVVGAAWGEARMRDPALPSRIAPKLHELMVRGVLRPPVGDVLPFARARDALRLLEERRAVGKVVLESWQED